MPSPINPIHTNANTSALNSGAKNELSELVNILKAKENLKSLKNEFQGCLNGKLV
ncbi:hypothetical protein [Helicobacter pylori]|uniref:hypothetical protein n=1 Tax=Helicobacter pylori TaxID=210 RepID=UPI00188438D6|nr:hypothetical protein [Helicobacter pylori]